MFQVLVFLGLGSVAWYLLIVLPQKNQRGTHERTLGQLGVGSNVMTVGGIFGRVQSIEGDTIVLEIAPGMVTRVASDGIARIVAGGEMPLPTAAPTHAPTAVAGHAAAQSMQLPMNQQHASDMHHATPSEVGTTMHEHTPQQQPAQPQPFGQPQMPVAGPGIHPSFVGQPMQAQSQPQFASPQYAAPQYAAPQFGAPQPQAAPEQQVVLRAAEAAPSYEPRPFTAFNLPAPPVFGRATAPAAHAPAAPAQAVYASQQPGYPVHQIDLNQQHYAQQPLVQQPVMQPYQPAPAMPRPMMPQQVMQQQVMHQPVMPQHHAAPQQYAHELPPVQQPVQPQMQVAAPAPTPAQPMRADGAVYQGAMPDTYDAGARTHSSAPQGMGANLRLDDPSLADIVDRARRERAELADEYRQLNQPMVAIEQVQPHLQQHVNVAPQHVVVQGQPQQLFVQPHAQIPAPATQHAATQQFPMPAIPPSADGHARPGIAPAQHAVEPPSAAAFYRAAPYAPQHEVAATPA